MKAIKYVIGIVALIGVVLAVVGIVIKDRLIRTAAITVIERETGFRADVEKVHVGLLRSTVRIENFELKNPPDFPSDTAFEIALIEVDYDLFSLLSDEVHLTKVVIDVSKAVMVRKADGDTNLERLVHEGKKKPAPVGEEKPRPPKKAKKAPASKGDTSRPAPREPKPAKKIRIDELTLRLGTVEMQNFEEEGKPPTVKSLDLGIDRTYRDVTDLETVAYNLSTEIAVNALPHLLDDLGTILQGDGGVEEAVKSLTEGKDLEEIGNQLEDIADELKKSFGDFF